MSLKNKIRIFAIDESGNEEEIKDLYWFEENGVHDFDDESFFNKFDFVIYINGEKINC